MFILSCFVSLHLLMSSGSQPFMKLLKLKVQEQDHITLSQQLKHLRLTNSIRSVYQWVSLSHSLRVLPTKLWSSPLSAVSSESPWIWPPAVPVCCLSVSINTSTYVTWVLSPGGCLTLHHDPDRPLFILLPFVIPQSSHLSIPNLEWIYIYI